MPEFLRHPRARRTMSRIQEEMKISAHRNCLRDVCPANVSFPSPRLIFQSTGTKDGPFKSVSFDEVLIGLQFPLHVHWDGATDSLRHCFVFVVLVINS
jgi:hypothetical protein